MVIAGSVIEAVGRQLDIKLFSKRHDYFHEANRVR